jgi:hypothetical protein
MAAWKVGKESHEAFLAQTPNSLPHGEQRGACTTRKYDRKTRKCPSVAKLPQGWP